MEQNLMKVKLYNTFTRKKEELIPITPGVVNFYSCGQTVYEDVHVGNAKTYIVWDTLVRTLKHFNYQIKHIQNFTDVGHLTDDEDSGDDKIAKRAMELKEDPMELVDRKICEYYRDMDRINIARPNIAPRATAHLIEMIDLIQKLLENGHAYESSGSVYYDISTFAEYGKLAKLDLENLKAGARVEVIEGKRNPGDFALWIKAPKEHIMKYTSPWSKGYPGWHLECSSMVMKYFGNTVDIHAGGIDHIPVHHTNEIAQSEGATGEKFANIWLHSAFITINGEKMSKSKNKYFIRLKEFIDEVGPGTVRMTFAQLHYRTQGDFSLKQAKSTKKRYNRLIRNYHFALQFLIEMVEDLDFISSKDQSISLEKFNKALADDLNTAMAVTQINTVSNKLDQSRKEKDFFSVKLHLRDFETMMKVLGIPYTTLSKDEIFHVNDLLKIRKLLKDEGKLEESDKVRNHLQNQQYVIQDQADGTSNWYKANL